MFDDIKAEIEKLKQLPDLLRRVTDLENQTNSVRTDRLELTSPDGLTKVILVASNSLSGLFLESPTYKVDVYVDNDGKIANVSALNKETGESQRSFT